jgi:DNA polymerase III subunit delta'
MHYSWHKTEFESLLKRRATLPHALLLRGPRGIGKLAFAEDLARALLCERPGPHGHACGQCSSCLWMEQGSHPDVRRLEPESASVADSGQAGEKREKAGDQISVSQVRNIGDFINVTSHRGRAKVILIHPAEAMNLAAANALLKSLEEPPPGTCFLLVAHRWHRILPTIRSRCALLALPLPGAGAAREWLQGEGIANADLALAQAGGAPLLAAGLDDAYWEQRATFFKAITGKSPDALAIAEQLRDQPPELVVGWLQKWAFDLASHKVTGAVRYNPDYAAAIAASARNVGLLDAVRFLRHMVRLQRIVAHPLNARLFFEDLLLGYVALLQGRRLQAAA